MAAGPGLWWGGAAVLLLLARWAAPSAFPSHPPFGRPPMDHYALQDMTAVLNGCRRLGADLGLVQWLQYYGSPEYADPRRPLGSGRRTGGKDADPHEGDGDSHDASHHAHAGDERASPSYPLLKEFGLRIGRLEPTYRYAYLITAGALAFNHRRYDEAFDVLEAGKRAEPTYWQYPLYIAAISYRQGWQLDRAIARLEEAVRHPDCSSMVKSILANLHIKQGSYARAAEILRQLIEDSRDRQYVDAARERLARLIAEGRVAP